MIQSLGVVEVCSSYLDNLGVGELCGIDLVCKRVIGALL